MAKYPRTFHLPNSPGGTNDDKRLPDWECFRGKILMATEKIDGSNVCMTPSDLFARSHSGPPTHESFDWLKAKYNRDLKWRINDLRAKHGNVEIFCEYAYAVHSIEYDVLPSYLFVIGARMSDYWLSWGDTADVATGLGLPTVPVIAWPPTLMNSASGDKLAPIIEKYAAISGRYGTKEGVVIRNYYGFEDKDFSKNVGKYVRANHVQTDEHWTNQQIQKQRLDGE
jgi:hypothetical protein